MAQNTLDLIVPRRTLAQKALHLNWLLIFLICAVAGVGFAMLYSAGGGSSEPWASRQLIRFAVCFALMIGVALIDIRLWMRAAYGIYAAAFVLLVGVEVLGATVMGAQRWVDLGVIQIQPSEVMKIALVLALARYFHGVTLEDMARLRVLVPPLAMILAPAALVLRQPDLGTAVLLTVGGGVMLFLAGLPLWKLGIAVGAVLGAIPIAWQFLHDYQKTRIMTFMNPEQDPLGAGYHILQSKIALGSGGLFGKGFLEGSQSRLNFLPEKQTDFIFTMLAEEFGLVGGILLLFLYVVLVSYAMVLAFRSNNHFGRLLGVGIAVTFFLYVAVNVAMVIGLIPVVGVPLPLISYGGSAMLTLMFGFGLVLCVNVHRDVPIGRRPETRGS